MSEFEELKKGWDLLTGNKQPCYYCGQPTDNTAGNLGLRAIPLPHSDEPDKMKWHHIGCVSERLDENTKLRARLAAAQKVVEASDGLSNQAIKKISDAVTNYWLTIIDQAK